MGTAAAFLKSQMWHAYHAKEAPLPMCKSVSDDLIQRQFQFNVTLDSDSAAVFRPSQTNWTAMHIFCAELLAIWDLASSHMLTHEGIQYIGC